VHEYCGQHIYEVVVETKHVSEPNEYKNWYRKEMVVVGEQKSLRPIAVCCSEVSICEHREVIAEKPSVSIDPEREHKGNGCNDTDRPIKLTAC